MSVLPGTAAAASGSGGLADGDITAVVAPTVLSRLAGATRLGPVAGSTALDLPRGAEAA